MKRRKVLAMLMTAVMTFTSVAPETALVAFAEGEEAAEDEDVVVEELPFDLKGMPEGYVLSEEQLEMKAAMQENDVVGALAGLTEGVDYQAGTMIALADSEEEAQAIADAYNSELVAYELGVAKIKLPDTLTVAQALTVAADSAYLMPVVEPNYVNHLIDAVEFDAELEISDDVFETAAATEAHASGWEKYVQKKAIGNPDTYLQDPASPYYQWMHDMIGTYAAWDGSMSSESIKVAVIDTGVLPDHPDLGGRVTQVAVPGVPAAVYTSSHATHVAGIIGATAGNGAGVAGVAPKVKIYSYNVFDAEEGCLDDFWIMALNSCAENGINVANMSLGGPGFSATAQTVINNVTAKGVNVVVAMGNDYSNLKSYPACYDNTISVSAVNPKGVKSAFSTYGKDADICAPGTNIMSCYNPKSLEAAEEKANSYVDASGYYGIMSGTSMATPVVAGVCALYMSKFGPQKTADMLKILQKNATKTSSKQIGKIVNVGKMFGSPAKSSAKSDDNKVFTFDIEGADEGAYVVYTTDGTDPSLVDGQIVNGQVFDGAVEFDADKDVVIVKSVVVTANGEIGEIGTASFTIADNKEAEIVGAKASLDVKVDPARVVNNKIYIYTTDVPKTSYDDTALTLTAPSSVSWSVDKKGAKVVEVAAAEGASTVIKALKTGKATITAKAADGSTAKIKVEVIVPASSISITPDCEADSYYAGHIAIGKSVTASPVIGSTYGKPSVTKVEYDYMVFDANTEADKTAAAQNAKAVKVSPKGKIKINKKNWEKAGLGEAILVVTAKTTDGTNLVAYAEYDVWKSPSTFAACDVDLLTNRYTTTKSVDLRSAERKYGPYGWEWQNGYLVLMGVLTDKPISLKSEATVTSSNPAFAGAKFYKQAKTADGKYLILFQVCCGEKRSGSAKITVTLNDGSKKKASITYKY